MDKLAEQLKTDAQLIDVQVSDALDRRINASLRANKPKPVDSPPMQHRKASFWWASSLTGVAAALTIVAIINSQTSNQAQAPNILRATPKASSTWVARTPKIDWKAESAMLISPLEQELLDLQSDLIKAEQKVKQDIGL